MKDRFFAYTVLTIDRKLLQKNHMTETLNVISVDFPLRGEWAAVNTPAHRIPSHGTNFFAQRYAFDFVASERHGEPSVACLLRHLGGRLSAKACESWTKPVFSPVDGVVASAADDWPDREVLSFVKDYMRASFFPPRVRTSDIRPLAGNYVIIWSGSVYAMLAHLRSGSILVQPAARVSSGQRIADVGNSGNTTVPHLHFQLMDGADPMKARAVSCCFRRYEHWNGLSWEEVRNGVPGKLEVIRVAGRDNLSQWLPNETNHLEAM